MIMDFIHFPMFEDIVRQCKDKIESQFPKYHNSWICTISDDYWDKRLAGELHEVIDSWTKEDRQKELIDLINVACMALETCEEQ